MWQGCWYIPDCGWNAESLWSWKGSADPWSKRRYCTFREAPYWMGAEHHRLPLQGQGHRPWSRKLSRPQIARPGQKGSAEVAENLLSQQMHNDDMLFGFLPGCSTTDAIFIVHQLQEMFHAVNRTLYMAFVNLEKAFDHVPRHVIWALHI